MESTRNNSRPSDIPHFGRSLGVTNITTDTQRISVDLRASEDAVKPVSARLILSPDMMLRQSYGNSGNL
jgi:hypothetical protein